MLLDALDGSARAHNPKVAGSNPAPATIESLVGAGCYCRTATDIAQLSTGKNRAVFNRR
jgi:hypothetical protein